MKFLYDIKDEKKQRIRVNLSHGEITIGKDDRIILERRELKEIEKRIHKMLQRYIPKAIKDAEEKGEIK